MNPAYLDTVFDLETHYQVPQAFVVITAYNPKGRTAPPSRNLHQDHTLRAVLENLGASPFRVTGRSLDGKHQEPGWGATLDLKTGFEIGKMFKQEAIYHIQSNQLTLHSCDGQQVEQLGSWSERINLKITP